MSETREIPCHCVADHFADAGIMVERRSGNQRQRRGHNPAQGNALGYENNIAPSPERAA